MALKRRFPWAASWPDSLVLHLARLGPVGKIGIAPGTNGSAIGIIFTSLLFLFLPPLVIWIITLFLVMLAFPICDEAEIRLGRSDPGEVIFDEFVVIPLCFIGLASQINALTLESCIWYAAGFLIFRLFDIVKPLGINKLQNVPGGYGVVLDDVAAAILTALVLNAGHWIFI